MNIKTSLAGLLIAVGCCGEIRPRPEATDYPNYVTQHGVSMAAERIPANQVRSIFATDLTRDYVVLEVALYPESGPLAVSALDFGLRCGNQSVRPGTPRPWRRAVTHKTRRADPTWIFIPPLESDTSPATIHTTEGEKASTPRPEFRWVRAGGTTRELRPPVAIARSWRRNSQTSSCPTVPFVALWLDISISHFPPTNRKTSRMSWNGMAPRDASGFPSGSFSIGNSFIIQSVKVLI